MYLKLSKTKTNRARTILTVLLVWFAVGMNAKTIHWITFINTADPNVGELDQNSRKVLYQRLINVVNSEVGKYDYDYNICDYYDVTFTPQSVKTCLDNIQCDTTDVVVFYYIGHGTRLSNDPERSTRYPYLFFDNYVNNCIPLSRIHQALREKQARLTLTIGVCANSYTGMDSNPAMDEVMLPSITRCEAISSIRNISSPIANLFLGYKGDMIVCSASPGQQTWGMQTSLGGMDSFTYSLVSCFENATEKKELSWPVFLEEISSQINTITKEAPFPSVQTPTYDYNLEQIRMPELKDQPNTPVEVVDSTSYENIRLRAHEKVVQFMDYYRAIADKRVNMATKKYYIQRVAELFLPHEGVIRLTHTNKRQPLNTVLPVKHFFERVANGLVRGEPYITAWEFCHNCKQIPLSEKEAEVTFCKHSDSIHKERNVCTMPNGYVTCTMPSLEDNEYLVLLTEILIDYVE